ncbi:MAG TPA: hypothetical protein PKN76_11180 [bacterium]|nr:hypothetical protein [bacterium]
MKVVSSKPSMFSGGVAETGVIFLMKSIDSFDSHSPARCSFLVSMC